MSDIVKRLRAVGCEYEHDARAVQEGADEITRLRATLAARDAEIERLQEALHFIERWTVYKRYKPDGKNLTAEEAVNIIAFHPAIQEITRKFEAAGEIDMAAYEAARAALTTPPAPSPWRPIDTMSRLERLLAKRPTTVGWFSIDGKWTVASAWYRRHGEDERLRWVTDGGHWCVPDYYLPEPPPPVKPERAPLPPPPAINQEGAE